MQGRTKGSISHVGISLKNLIEILGPNFNGQVVVSRPWLDKIVSPTEYKMIKCEGEDEQMIDTKPASDIVVGARPQFEID